MSPVNIPLRVPPVPSLEDPIPAYRFLVTLDPSDAYLPRAQSLLILMVASGGFQEVKGLSGDLEVFAYPEGGNNDFVHQLPVRHTWSRIQLKRGLIRDPGLFYWYQAGLTNSLGARRDGCIILLTAKGTPAVAWGFRGGIVVKWNGPELSATSNGVAIESLEIAHHGIQQVPLSMPGME